MAQKKSAVPRPLGLEWGEGVFSSKKFFIIKGYHVAPDYSWNRFTYATPNAIESRQTETYFRVRI